MTQPTFVESEHPRAGGKFVAKSKSAQQAQQQLPAATQANIRDFQKRMGIKQTGQFDAATMSAISRTSSAKGGKGGAGGKSKAATAAKAAARKQATVLKHQAALAAKAQKTKVAVAKKTAAAAAKAQVAQSHATALAVNKLPASSRATYRQRTKGVPPVGYQWTAKQTLVAAPAAAVVVDGASASKSVAAVLAATP